MMKVGCYIRVSTQEQAKEGYSIAAQTQRLKAYCISRGWSIYKFYIDPAFSGAKMDRPALKKLIEDVLKRQIDIVLVYKLDRLSRSQKDTLYLIEDVFMKNNVSFISVNESFDTSTAFGRAVIGMLSVFAQLEREQIKERCQMGLEERVKSGLWHGGGNPPIGYDYVNGHLVINEYEALQVREIYNLYVNEGYSLNAITKYMQEKGYKHKYGEWLEPINIRRTLTNPTYLGLQKWNDNIYEGKHEPIVTKELFDAGVARVEERTLGKTNPSKKPCFHATQLLTGILYCKKCGARYYGQGAYRGSKKLPYSQRTYIHIYSCYSRTKTKKSMIKDPNCKNKNWKAEELDEIIKGQILKLAIDEDFVKQLKCNTAKKEDNLEVLTAQIDTSQKKMQKLLDLYLNNKVQKPDIASKLEALSAEIQALQKTYHELECTNTNKEAYAETTINITTAIKEILYSDDTTTKRRLVQSLIKKIEIDEDTIFIYWRF